jgi:hypothetical protein
MTDPESMDTILKQIEQILEILHMNKGKTAKPLSKELRQQLDKAKEDAILIEETIQKNLTSLGIDDKALKNTLDNLDQLPPSEKKRILRLKHLQEELIGVHKELGQDAANAPETERGTGTQSKRTRKKKFDPTGARKGWKPL